ncbi:hypothetical protein [Paenibacillus sp. DYY-L-2]|uniref:hypothetical protein n=1 Tax=Paenibacillus sp. DYY-L-2 TaxID=3447013 RepID=UPI003F4FF095
MIVTDLSKKETVVLESKELSFLAELLGADCQDCKVNPFRGYFQGGLKEDTDEIRDSLIAKGVLQQAAGQVEISQQMLSSLAAVLFADKACWMRYKTETEMVEEVLHISDERIVALQRKEDDSELLFMDEIGNVRQACGMLAGKMRWNLHTPDELPALLLSRRKFAEIVMKLDELEWEEILSELSAVSDDHEGLIAFAKCMKTSIAHGDLRFYARQGGDWESQSAKFINNHHMNWLIRSSSREEEDWLIATPTTNAKFQEMLESWIQQS